MPLMLTFDPDDRELALLRQEFTRLAARRLPDDWRCRGETHLDAACQIAEEELNLQLCCADVTCGGTSLIALARKRHSALWSVVIADERTSPAAYITPEIMASGILLRPIDPSQASGTLGTVVDDILCRQRESRFAGQAFTVDIKEEIIRVPYASILYFEARAKKIVLCTAKSELSFPGTLEGLAALLPEYFVRCHKGFLVNTLMVEKFSLQAGTLCMLGGVELPVSRSCKASVKDALK